jgi:hypothetical protein
MLKFWKKEIEPAPLPKHKKSFWGTHAFDHGESFASPRDIVNQIVSGLPSGTMDDSSNGAPSLKIVQDNSSALNDVLMMWYASQGFIGHQLCGILSQNWLINKACAMPARDAIRNGYSVASIDGDDMPENATKIINYYDRKFLLNKHLEDFVYKGRIFGIRIALFKVESTDPDYYEKPFNLDGITPNSYKGIVQVDPYWCAPMLDGLSAAQPDSLHFYEPTWWIINGVKHHRSHLIIFRNSELVDLLKPSYLYGGIPVPQQIMERVYAAERVANEAPQLAQTKRTTVWMTDMEKFVSAGDKAISSLNDWSYYRDNYSLKIGDKESDEFNQFDTTLADLDSVIMTQYQIVAAAANVPATKLLGTTPKGFNSTGEYEEASYHEELKSIQANHMTALAERHHELVMKSYIAPKFGYIQTAVTWKPLDTPTALELAQTNLAKAQVGAALIASGAISSEDERARVAKDKESGYNELGEDDVPAGEESMDEDFKESDHPRADNGQFGSGGLSGAAGIKARAEERAKQRALQKGTVENKESKNETQSQKIEIGEKSIKQVENENKSTYPKVPVRNVFFHDVGEVDLNVKINADKSFENGGADVENVNVKDLIPTQRNVTIPNIKDVAGVKDFPDVIKYKGKYYIIDGHHRTARDILDGEASIKVNVYNADK